MSSSFDRAYEVIVQILGFKIIKEISWMVEADSEEEAKASALADLNEEFPDCSFEVKIVFKILEDMEE